MKQDYLIRSLTAAIIWLLLLFSPKPILSQDLIKLPFPYGPLGLNSVPFVAAKQTRLFEKHSLAVDMVYVGASAVMVNRCSPAPPTSAASAVRQSSPMC